MDKKEEEKYNKGISAEIAENLWCVVKKYSRNYDEKTLNEKPTGYFIVFTNDKGTWSHARNTITRVVFDEIIRAFMDIESRRRKHEAT